jgi:hypothetical protein
VNKEMQILNIVPSSDAPFFCPLTGNQLFGCDMTDHGDSPNLQGVWLSEIISEPSKLRGKMKEAWASYDPEKDDFEDWLGKLEFQDHFAISVTERPPSHMTAWYVFSAVS